MEDLHYTLDGSNKILVFSNKIEHRTIIFDDCLDFVYEYTEGFFKFSKEGNWLEIITTPNDSMEERSIDIRIEKRMTVVVFFIYLLYNRVIVMIYH